jgi:replicative DNA helicase
MDEHSLEVAPVPADDFYSMGHGLIVNAMHTLRRARVPIDTVTIRVELSRTDSLRRAGGDEALLALTNHVPNVRTAYVLAARIQELAELRRRRDHAQRIIQECNATHTDAARTLCATIGSAYDPSTVRVLTFKEVVDSTLREYQDMGTERDRSVMLGIPTVDQMWRPYPGSVTTIGAATGSGKTSVMCMSALSLGRRGIPVGIVSVEDPEQDFGGKWIGELGADKKYALALSGDPDRPTANPAKFWKGQATAADHELALRAAAEHEGLPIFFAHVKSRKLDDVLIAMRAMARRHRTRVTMLDYLQVVRPRERHKDRRDAIDSILDEVIVEGSMLEQALVLASQISRDGAKQAEPRVQDLKESGTIEERSQCILLVWPAEKKSDTAYCKIAKVKRVTTGRRFTLVRRSHTGVLEEESDDEYGAPDPTDADAPGYAVGGYGKGKKK